MKPNIFLLTIDSIRGSKFFGKEKSSHTPNLDNIIKNGLFFDTSIASSDQTGTSLASIFTGKFPMNSGVTQFNFNFNFETFFDKLENLDYNLYSCITDLAMFKKFTKNFTDNLEYEYGGVNSYPHLDNELGSKIFKRFFENHMAEPWFFYCHLMDLKDPEVLSKEFDNEKFGNTTYDRNISALDIWIGKFLKQLDLTNTLFVITTDHGEYVPNNTNNIEQSMRKVSNVAKKVGFLNSIGKKPFSKSIKFARKMKQKQNDNLSPHEKRNYTLKRAGTELFDDLVKVPLLFIGCGINKNKMVSSQVRHVDIFPTIFELLDLPLSDVSLDGISNVSKYNDSDSIELPCYIETGSLNPKILGKTIGVRTSNYKYFRSRDNPTENIHLYDLQNDPNEDHNLSDEIKIQKMELILKNFLNKSENTLSSDLSDEESKLVEEELRKFGYID